MKGDIPAVITFLNFLAGTKQRFPSVLHQGLCQLGWDSEQGGGRWGAQLFHTSTGEHLKREESLAYSFVVLSSHFTLVLNCVWCRKKRGMNLVQPPPASSRNVRLSQAGVTVGLSTP